MPAVTGVVVMAPRASAIDLAQLVGRALRLSPATGKTMAFIVLPAIVSQADLAPPRAECEQSASGESEGSDASPPAPMLGDEEVEESDAEMDDAGAEADADMDDADADTAVADLADADVADESAAAVSAGRKRERAASGAPEKWRGVVDTLRALLRYDKDLASCIAALCSSRPQGADKVAEAEAALRELIDVVGGDDMDWAVLERCVFSVLHDWLGETFDERIGQLQAIVDAGGNPNVPERDAAHAGLGKWLGNQRYAFRKGKLSGERLKRLRAVPRLSGFAESDRDKAQVVFEDRVGQLHAIVDAGGNPNVPGRDTAHAGLGGWLRKQRYAFHKGKLSGERLEKLRAVPGLKGFD